MRGEDFEVVAPHAEGATLERVVVALVLQGDQLAHDLALVDAFPHLEVEDHRRIGLDRADAIEARDRGDDDHVVAFEQRARGRVAHPVDGLVHRAFLLDVGIGPGHIGFGLVIIVVRDEIFDRVLGEEAFHLAIELGREDLVGREDQRRALQFLDYLGHREGLARAGDAEQHLRFLVLLRACHEGGDRGRLVARRVIVGHHPERAARLQLFGAHGLVGNEGARGVGFFETPADDDFGHGQHMGNIARRCNRPLQMPPPAHDSEGSGVM